ncbi:MAG: hypothetical protein P8O74_00660 [Paracoccaceae bacterium]|jgi:hypothetical protein|nr:hypothetical protein [Paracoccaceae bacterium]MDG2248910.1 hypothetical protein [Paracoccaceae bacterium]|tara:strand:- start:223 stop:678 length:456 start_codon:yes stop_codon:yes gene_type:complete
MVEEDTPKLHKDRNKILMQYADQSFSSALDEINASLKSEKNHSKKLALLSAKSWVLRNKLYASIHDPYIYTLNEIENTDVFDDMDDEDQSAIDNLFDDEAPEKMVEVTILKSTTLNGKKLVKDTILEVTEENATKLVDDGKAKISEPEVPK